MREFFRGRYGPDALGYFMFFAAILAFNFKYGLIPAAALAGYAIFRMLSKNINKRAWELQNFNRIMWNISAAVKPIFIEISKQFAKLRNKIAAFNFRRQQRKLYVFVSCPNCKKTLRLPVKKQKLKVTCPVCKHEFVKKT